ncbi:hypothetical protein [Hymenobacter sp. PAMC 26628]|uniref:hypothetical protein n=1 Tax=Hymenobacter sp. PAMC 26628 TaxID=1484118 RepID=UPI0007706237|nr:hypothetical protein [Hymenobacter sp. PAMC 26628]AMJ65574.1 hypothetical protein AXW84_09120 [Hymenobacter sp. PAMC 26628]
MAISTVTYRLRALALGGLLALAAAGCRTCPIESCHVRKKHLHNGTTYRGQPLWKKQNPAVGEKIRISGPSGAKPLNNHAKPLK